MAEEQDFKKGDLLRKYIAKMLYEWDNKKFKLVSLLSFFYYLSFFYFSTSILSISFLSLDLVKENNIILYITDTSQSYIL